MENRNKDAIKSRLILPPPIQKDIYCSLWMLGILNCDLIYKYFASELENKTSYNSFFQSEPSNYFLKIEVMGVIF